MAISLKCKLLLYAEDSALIVSGSDPQSIADIFLPSIFLPSIIRGQESKLVRVPPLISSSDCGSKFSTNSDKTIYSERTINS